MRLCKYRDLSTGGGEQLRRVFEIIETGGFWCAAPSSFNDDSEFIWDCDYAPTDRTTSLLTSVLAETMPAPNANAAARTVVAEGRLEEFIQPRLEAMMAQCRSELGVVSFCCSSDNDTMWSRYGGGGNGVCIEIEAPDEILGREVHSVQYVTSKRIHVDDFLASQSSSLATKFIYDISLLTKQSCWAPESEVRFVSKLQNVYVRISNSRLSRVVLGDRIDNTVATSFSEHSKLRAYELAVRCAV
jgi:hypothetical protein